MYYFYYIMAKLQPTVKFKTAYQNTKYDANYNWSQQMVNYRQKLDKGIV